MDDTYYCRWSCLTVYGQRRINTCRGEIKLLMDGRLRWQGQDWTSCVRHSY
ncbi:hypothetical protein KCP71_11040 [Salmonella enterica subsp. enterica]|nr:hypothetical protein KCP71_11040 [Salmonella enterica subsp. enterica]